VDRFATGLVDREFIEIFARLAVMLRCTVEMGAVALLLDERHDHFERRANVSHYAKIDRRAAADLLGPDIHLRDFDPRPPRIELAIRKIGPEHQENVAIEHGVVPGRETDQPGHADVKRVIPLHMLLASKRMHDGRFQAIRECEDLIVCALTSRAA
jgi:hypothetical protein